MPWVNLVVLNNSSDDFADIFLIIHPVEKSCDPIKFSIAGIIVPGDCGDGVFGLEKVGHWRVVHNNHVLHWTPKSRQIFYERVVKESAVLSEQKIRAHLAWIKVQHQGLCVLRQTSCEYDEFVFFVHLLKELGNERPD